MHRSLDSNEIQGWMYGEGRKLQNASLLMHGFCTKLNEQGMSLRRANLLVRTRQPQLEMLVYIWRPAFSTRVEIDTSNKVVGVRRDVYEGGEVETVLLAMGHTDEQIYRQSPFHACLPEKGSIRRNLLDDSTEIDFPILEDLALLGVTDYFVMPVDFPEPYVGALSVATDAQDGFDSAQLLALESAEPVIALGFGPHVVHQATLAVLAAYIGIDPAHKVMAGAVRIGDSEELDAVIGFTDLRGFTTFSHVATPARIVEKLTRFFGAVQLTVSDRGGEILKFMGDGAMFVFPVGEYGVSGACETALEAIRELKMILGNGTASSEDSDAVEYRFTTALHYGRVLYGNIGSVERLDFTVLGNAVNKTARLEPVAKKLGQDIVVSKEFAESCPGEFRSLGLVELRGIPQPVEVLTPER
jgi:adenylate cyclase